MAHNSSTQDARTQTPTRAEILHQGSCIILHLVRAKQKEAGFWFEGSPVQHLSLPERGGKVKYSEQVATLAFQECVEVFDRV